MVEKPLDIIKKNLLTGIQPQATTRTIANLDNKPIVKLFLLVSPIVIQSNRETRLD